MVVPCCAGRYLGETVPWKAPISGVVSEKIPGYSVWNLYHDGDFGREVWKGNASESEKVWYYRPEVGRWQEGALAFAILGETGRKDILGVCWAGHYMYLPFQLGRLIAKFPRKYQGDLREKVLNRLVSVRNMSCAEEAEFYTEIVIFSVRGSGQSLLNSARKTMIYKYAKGKYCSLERPWVSLNQSFVFTLTPSYINRKRNYFAKYVRSRWKHRISYECKTLPIYLETIWKVTINEVESYFLLVKVKRSSQSRPFFDQNVWVPVLESEKCNGCYSRNFYGLVLFYWSNGHILRNTYPDSMRSVHIL